MDAIAFPPLKCRNGENACPKIGAIEIKTSSIPLTLNFVIDIYTGTNAFNKSKIIQIAPVNIPKCFITLAEPGL